MESTTFLVVTVTITLAVFIVGREFFTWYWKINKIVENQHEQIDLLKKLVEKEQEFIPSKNLDSNHQNLTRDQKAAMYDAQNQ